MCLRMSLLPIVVDRSLWGRAFYLETLPRRTTYDVVTRIVYPALLPGQSVTVETALEPLDRQGVVFPTEGALVRVAPTHDDQPPLVALDVALQNLDWSRDLATFGMPTSEDPRGKLLVLSADHSFLLTTDIVTNRAGVLRQVAALLQFDIRDVYLVWPEDDDMDHISFQGRPAAGAVTRYGDSRRVSHSLAGSRLGESWADLIFSFVYSRILQNIAEEAAAHDFAATVPWNGCESPWFTSEATQSKQVPLPDVTWADDSVFIAMARNAVELTPRMFALVETVLSVCAKHGLIPNLKLGKTGIVLGMRGAGKKRELNRLFPHNRKTLEVRLASGELSVVHIQAQYTHLGGVLDRDGSMAAEARRRLAMARSSFDRQRRMLFQNRYVCLHVRGNFFRSLVTSTFNNLALWTEKVKSWPTMAAGYDRLLRRPSTWQRRP